jgi:hypothetical protein
MKIAVIAMGLLLVAAGTATADEISDTFDKVNRALYGTMPGAAAPVEPREQEEYRQQEAEPAQLEREREADMTWDFETGDLRGWVASGEAFRYQPTYGDNPTERHRGQPSRHQGDYWIGGYEKRPTPDDQPGAIQGDGPQGTLTSQPFTVQSSAISFLIGGGCDINTERVEILVDGRVVHKATGRCTETMERVSFSMTRYSGRSAQIRLIDSSGGGWGHINFDDVRFE